MKQIQNTNAQPAEALTPSIPHTPNGFAMGEAGTPDSARTTPKFETTPRESKVGATRPMPEFQDKCHGCAGDPGERSEQTTMGMPSRSVMMPILSIV